MSKPSPGLLLTFSQALIRAQSYGSTHQDDKLGLIHSCTKGVVFLGTPHRGSDKKGLIDIVSGIMKLSMHNANTQLLASLLPESQFLEEQRDLFNGVGKDFPLKCLFEEYPTNGGMVSLFRLFALLMRIPLLLLWSVLSWFPRPKRSFHGCCERYNRLLKALPSSRSILATVMLTYTGRPTALSYLGWLQCYVREHP